MPPDITTLVEACDWLADQAHAMLADCRRTMADGTIAYPPQVGCHYEAFWLRDYAYMLEGSLDAFPEPHVRAAYACFLAAQRADGACVDCVTFDGTPIYQPGYGSMGANPVADGSQFLIDVAWHTFLKTGDIALLADSWERLLAAMAAIPRNPATGLVHIRPDVPWERCPYGFTDSVRKTGDLLFCSLLLVQACRQLADIAAALDRRADCSRWQGEAERVTRAIQATLWDADSGLFLAATVGCRQPDIWGSAFAVFLDVASPAQVRAITTTFQTHLAGIVQTGQLRHLLPGQYWEAACGPDIYQNGAYWATPIGWFVDALDRTAPRLAEQIVLAMVHDFIRRGTIPECVNGTYLNVPGYLASATLPLVGIRRMLVRRDQNPHHGD